MTAPRGRAIVLVSGGVDSATCLAIARAQGHECHALSFAYGQRHRQELDAARRVARAMGVCSHRVVEIDLAAFGGSALTDPAIEVPKGPAPAPGAPPIPITYVPARNTIFIAFALAMAEVLDARAIYLGINAVDYSGYPDCRPEYLEACQRVSELATRAGVEGRGPTLVAPLLHLAKAQIIRRGLELGVDFAMTLSCYDPAPPVSPGQIARPCGGCEACRIRAAAFAQLGVPDPALALSSP